MASSIDFPPTIIWVSMIRYSPKRITPRQQYRFVRKLDWIKKEVMARINMHTISTIMMPVEVVKSSLVVHA